MIYKTYLQVTARWGLGWGLGWGWYQSKTMRIALERKEKENMEQLTDIQAAKMFKRKMLTKL